MNILGISAGFHDAGISFISNDKILFAAHSERYSKNKHDSQLNTKLLSDCITQTGRPDQIAYYERPWLKKTRQLYAGQYRDAFNFESVSSMLDRIAPWANLKNIPVKHHSHHLSHAASGFQTSPYDDATVVVIDAIGEWDTISIWDATYDSNGYAKYKKLWSQKYPHSLGMFYSAMTQRAGLLPMDEEYILMGMAAYGQYDANTWGDFLESAKDIRFKENLHIGCQDWMPEMINFDVAASAQWTLETCLHQIMLRADELGKSKNLVYMGGVALNCLANEHLGAYFNNIWIMPNPGDAGSSLGAAALSYGKKLNWQGPYLGTDILGEYPVKELLNELVTNKIVGVANGRAEFGPRALGNRSLLADPRGKDIKDQVNQIKHRQKFRPFAPVILEELVDDYFDMPIGFKSSPYMQAVGRCKQPKKYPAIVHKDGTSRVQTVGKDCPSGIRKLLEAWYQWTGCPMLLNTSLNIRGEPMVNDISDANRFEETYKVKVLCGY
jgi:carbamoyltransferase